MDTFIFILTAIVVPFMISLLSNIGVWEIPYRRWVPDISIDNFNTHIIERKDGEKDMRISVDLKNQSNHDAYRIEAYYECITMSKTGKKLTKYVRKESRALIRKEGCVTIAPPLKYESLKEDEISSIKICVIFQNKFGATISKEKEFELK